MKLKTTLRRFSVLFITLFLQQSSFAQINSFVDMDSAYYARKHAGINNGQALSGNKVLKATQSAIKPSKIPPGQAGALSALSAAANCIIAPGNDWISLPANDDGSTGAISLGFNFSLYGITYNQVYINNNGNLTFTEPYPIYSAAGFPFSTAMVAPFWADVMTTCGPVVKYKLNDHNLIVCWPGVGRYNANCNLADYFEVVISDGTDPLLGIGNNVAFYYGDMQWTTGDASGGVNGFGGTPATVGVNSGDGINYVQVGRFSMANSDYDGGGGAEDGVYYLDNKCFTFDVSAIGNQPPSFSGLPPGNTLTVNCGETVNLAVQALPPEVDQTVAMIVNTGDICNFTASPPTTGTMASTNLSITGSPCNTGAHIIRFSATDNGSPAKTTMDSLIVNVVNLHPVITNCAPNQTLQLDANCNTILPDYTGLVTATSCIGPVAITQSPAAGTTQSGRGTLPLTFTATDINGNSATCSMTLTKKDGSTPVVTTNGNQVLTNSTNACGAFFSVSATAKYRCSNEILTGIRSDGIPITNLLFPVGTTTISWYVTDDQGNTSVGATQTITVTDNEKPTIGLPDDVVVTANSGCTATGVVLGTPNTDDNCGVASVTNNAPAAFPIGTTTVTWTVTDIHGNQATGTQLVTVTNNSTPSITAPPNVAATTNAGCNATGVLLGTPDTGNNCGPVTITNDHPSSTYPLGTTTVTWTVTGSGGKTATATQTVTVTDNTNPTITVPANVEATTNTGCNATGVALGTPSTGDNCSVTSVTNDAPAAFPLGLTTVTWTVTDNSGNTASATQTVTVTDNTNPTITAPANVEATTNTGCTATGVVLGSPSTGDNCSVKSVTNDAPAAFPLGLTTVTWTVTDNSGNMATATQTVTVKDNVNPAISAPAHIDVPANNGCSASGVDLGTPATSDNCGVATVTNDHPSPDYPLGTTTVTWTVTDNSGNTATAVQTVTVTDNTNPTITAPANVEATTNTGCNATGVALGTPSTGDNCSVTSVTNDAPAAFPLGLTTVTWTVTDNSGNTASATQTVTVTDNTNPTITAPANVEATTNTGCTATGVVLGSPSTGDNCSVKSVTNDAPVAFPLGLTTVTWTVTDNSGNMATATQTVTVKDNVNPAISAPAHIDVPANNGCSASGVDLGTPATSDNCGVATVTNDHPSPDYPLGTTTVTWTVTDNSGNTATAVQTVTVTDNTNPTITAPANVEATTNTGCNVTGVALGSPSTGDNCSVTSVTNDAPAAFPLGLTTVTWTVTDNSGNTASATQTVTVTDNIQPVITTNGNQNVNIAPGSPGASVSVSAVATDNCSVGSPTGVRSDGLALDALYPPGTTTITWNVTDVNGNQATTAIQTIVVSNNQQPVLTTNGNKQVNNDPGVCGAIVTVSATATGGATLGTPTGVRSDGLALNALFPVGTTTINWTVSDNYGNTATASQTVTVVDNQKPVFTNCPQNITTIGCNSVTYTVTASDNCPGNLAYTYSFSGAVTAQGNGTGSGTKFPAGVTHVTITAKDPSGNASQCSFNVTSFTGNLSDYFMVFTDGSVDANWQGSSNGFIGNVAVAGIQAAERTSGTVPYAGTITTNSGTLGAWQNIINSNTSQASASFNQGTTLTDLESQLENAFALINAQPATTGYSNINVASLNGLNTQNGVAETFVINITSGFQVSSQIKITGDANDLFILRWDNDANFSNGYNGQVKFQSGGAIVPMGGLTAANFINVAGDINSSGGGSNPAAPYPQGPRTNSGTGSLINGGKDFKGGGFFTGYWLTTGAPTIFVPGQQPYGQTSSQSNAIFVGGWYTKSTKFSLTSGTSGVYVGGCSLQNTPASITTSTFPNEVFSKTGSSHLAVKVLPNPTSHYFQIGLTSASIENVKIKIMDDLGRIVEQKTVSANSNFLIGNQYHSGIYFASFLQGIDRVVLKLIKEGK